MKFKSVYKHERMSQKFDPDFKITMAGKEYVVKDMIQEAREDTEIYPTLEKYGCIDKMKLDANKVYGDFTAFKDLRTMKDQQIAAQKMWLDLPYDVRAHFQNNVHTFLKEGEKYLQDEIAKLQPKETIATEQPKETVAEVKGE